MEVCVIHVLVRASTSLSLELGKAQGEQERVNQLFLQLKPPARLPSRWVLGIGGKVTSGASDALQQLHEVGGLLLEQKWKRQCHCFFAYVFCDYSWVTRSAGEPSAEPKYGRTRRHGLTHAPNQDH